MIRSFTRFSGRISRKTWWLGNLLLVAIAAAFTYGMLHSLGYSFGELTNQTFLRDEYKMELYLQRTAGIQLFTLILLFVPSTALMVQRLNDRDRPMWLMAVFWAPTVILTMLAVGGKAYEFRYGAPQPTTMLTTVTWLSYGTGLWALIELGFLAGTPGENAHGPDPITS
ncbi:DUF805 domain-containing protein [Tabrizicola sp.]|uniref:DUF805 domain-containing protein n=1 Tax=Tabrizicola sp. TaxID=2005166 RepID=UPI003F3E428B